MPTIKKGLTCHLAFAIFTAVLGMFQFGYNTGVINAPQSTFQEFIVTVWYDRYNEEISENSRKFLWSLAVSIFAIGGMVGGFLGGAIANRFGRKRGLLLAGVIGIIGASFMATCKLLKTFELLIIGRFIIGVNCGLYTSLSPMYVSELAPVNLRGGLGTINQLAVTIGLLLSQILGLDKILGTENGWNILLGLAICPPALQMLLLIFCPESPRYLLLTKGWEESARAALIKLRNCGNVEDDIEEMRTEDRLQQEDIRVTMFEMLRTPHLRAPLIIAVVMQLSQQLSGINAVLYYSTNLFITSGLNDESARLATIGVGSVMVFMTIASIPMMDRAGRRTLMLYGLGGMFIFSIFITISLLVKIMVSGMAYLSIASILCFVMFFSVGPGSIPWMITAELFSHGPRPSAISIATLVNWTANFIVGIGFLPMKNAIDDYTFLPFTGLLAIFWIFTYQKVPETKFKTFEEITAIFRRHNPNTLNSIHGSAKLCQLRENSSLIAYQFPLAGGQ
ncbi:Solute carrier 2, facilitated glucose transporter member 1 [Chamberlinius hualienensis]